MKILDVVEESYKRIGSPKKIAVAVSGGADSMALLYALYQIRDKFGFDLLCVHVNHGLRNEAVYEEEKVIDFCKTKNIDCVSERVYVEKKGSVELNARVARYEAFEKIRKEKAFDVLALAHHKVDQAETVLMRLFYGTGVKALSGIRELNSYLWRPFLSLDKDELIQYLEENEVDYSTDSSNFDTKYTRNAIRHRLIPEIEKIYPKAVDSIYRLSRILETESDYIERHVAEWMKDNSTCTEWLFETDLSKFSSLDLAIQRRVLFNALEGLKISASFESIEAIVAVLNRGEKLKVNLSCDSYALISDKLSIIAKHRISDFAKGSISETEEFEGFGDGVFRQAFDFEKVEGAEIRKRRLGDRFMLFDGKQHKSLKEYMIDKKIPQLFRNDWPIYALGNEVLWVIGFGASGYGKVDETTKSILKLEYSGTLPDGRKN